MAGSREVARQEIVASRPDVVLLDAQLPDDGALQLCRELRVIDDRMRCLFLSATSDPETLAVAIEAGAWGYVHKSIDGSALMSGVKLVAGGQPLIGPELVAEVAVQMEAHRTRLDVLLGLTNQQRRILMLITEGLTNRQIGERMHLAEKTVKNHVTRLLSRLGVATRTQAAVLGVGLRDGGVNAPFGGQSRFLSARQRGMMAALMAGEPRVPPPAVSVESSGVVAGQVRWGGVRG